MTYIPPEKPSEQYDSGLISRLMDGIHNRIDALADTTKLLGKVTKAGFDVTHKRIDSVSSTASSADEATNDRGVSTPVGLTAKVWFKRLMIAKFDFQRFHRIKGVRNYEWHLGTSSDFEPSDNDGDLADRIYHTPGNRLICWMPTSAYHYVKVRAIGWRGAKSPYSSAADGIGCEIPAVITSINNLGVLPLKIGWFKRVQWRLNIGFTWEAGVGGDTGLNGKFEIQYRRLTNAIGDANKYGPIVRHYVDLESTDLTTEHNLSLVYPPRNMVTAANGYIPGEATNLLVRIRSWENGNPGAWYPPDADPDHFHIPGPTIYSCSVITKADDTPDTYWVQVPFVSPDDAEMVNTTTGGKWYPNDEGGGQRSIIVQCCSDTWDAPNTFSHFSIHIRRKVGTTDWDPIAGGMSMDLIHGNVSLESGVSGVRCRIPLFVQADNSLLPSGRKYVKVTELNDTYLEVKVLIHYYGFSTKYKPLSTKSVVLTYDGTLDTATTLSPPTNLNGTVRFKRMLNASCTASTAEGNEASVKYYYWEVDDNNSFTSPTPRYSFRPHLTCLIPPGNRYIRVMTVGWRGSNSTWSNTYDLLGVTSPKPTPSQWYFDREAFGQRRVKLRCCETNYSFPDNFAFFTVHVRWQANATSANWTPETSSLALSTDFVCRVREEDAIDFVHFRVPWYIKQVNGTGPNFIHNYQLGMTEAPYSHLHFKVVPWIFNTSHVPVAVTASTSDEIERYPYVNYMSGRDTAYWRNGGFWGSSPGGLSGQLTNVTVKPDTINGIEGTVIVGETATLTTDITPSTTTLPFALESGFVAGDYVVAKKSETEYEGIYIDSVTDNNLNEANGTEVNYDTIGEGTYGEAQFELDGSLHNLHEHEKVILTQSTGTEYDTFDDPVELFVIFRPYTEDLIDNSPDYTHVFNLTTVQGSYNKEHIVPFVTGSGSNTGFVETQNRSKPSIRRGLCGGNINPYGPNWKPEGTLLSNTCSVYEHTAGDPGDIRGTEITGIIVGDIATYPDDTIDINNWTTGTYNDILFMCSTDANYPTLTEYMMLQGPGTDLGGGVTRYTVYRNFKYTGLSWDAGTMFVRYGCDGGTKSHVELTGGSTPVLRKVTTDAVNYAAPTSDDVQNGIFSRDAMMTPEGGLAIKCIADVALARGEVVCSKQGVTVAGEVKKCPTSGNEASFPIGVVYQDAVQDAEVWVVVSGIAYVLPEAGITAAKGFTIFTSASTAGRVDQISTVPAAEHWRECGHWLDGKATDDASADGVLTRAVLHFN